MPERIQLRRRKGWRKPVTAVVVTRPTKWGNPHVVRGLTVHHPNGTETVCATVEDAHRVAVDRHRADLEAARLQVTVADVRAELTGLDICCTCPLDLPCHGDTYLEVANP